MIERHQQVLDFLSSGPRFTEEIRRHIADEYYTVIQLLRRMKAKGLIEQSRQVKVGAPTRWRIKK